jgi:hypothetical protein
MSRVQEILDKSAESQATMLRIVERIDPEQKVYPEWKIKQVLAHLAGWDEAITASLKSFLRGGTPELVAHQGVDIYNANSVSTRDELPIEHIIREYKLERARLQDALKELKDEQLDSVIIYPWGNEGSIYNLVNAMADHEVNHAKEIEEVLDGKRDFDAGHH